MKCPVCSNLLQQVKTESSVLDVCPNCKGLWFDSEELADFVKSLSQSDRISPKETKLFERIDVQTLRDIEEKDKFCPRCSQKMRKFNYSYDSNIFLDKCSDCGGIWADGGEAQAIAKYIKEDPNITVVGKALAEHLQTLEKLRDFKVLEREEGTKAIEKVSRFLLFFPRVIIPISDDTPRQRFPIVTVSIIVICALVFIAQFLSDPGSLVNGLNFVPEKFWAVDLISSMVAQPGPIHFIWNILFLWLFGDNVEDRFSRFGYLVFFLSCGLIASLLFLICNLGVPVSTAGVSGAVSGIMGAYFVFYPTAKIKLFVIYKVFEIPAVICLGAWFLFQFIAPFLLKAGTPLGTICMAHIGGFVFGAVVAYLKKTAMQVREQS